MTQKFPLGRIVATPGALSEIPAYEIDKGIWLHSVGEWGVLDAEDQQENERALKAGDRLFSAYCTATGTKFWIITEADRSSTCVLLPSEY